MSRAVNKKEKRQMVEWSLCEKILKQIVADVKTNPSLQQAYECMVKNAVRYGKIREDWSLIPWQQLPEKNRKRRQAYDEFIAALNILADAYEKDRKPAWRIELGDEGALLGNFAVYVGKVNTAYPMRMQVLYAVLWASENAEEVAQLISYADSVKDAKKYFVLKGFTENQAQCILDVRIKSCCKEQKEKVYREMEVMDKLCIVEPQSILPSMNENKITI